MCTQGSLRTGYLLATCKQSACGAEENGPAPHASGAHDGRLPPPAELFWKGLEVQVNGRTIYGNVWPKVQITYTRVMQHGMNFFRTCIPG